MRPRSEFFQPRLATDPRPILSQRDLVGLVWCRAGTVLMPGRCWPLEVALQVLGREARAGSAIGQAVLLWPRAVTSEGRVYVGVSAVVRQLARDGLVHIEGEGWHAGYRPNANWYESCHAKLRLLERHDQRAVTAASHRVVSCLTSWSKNWCADRESKLVTS